MVVELTPIQPKTSQSKMLRARLVVLLSVLLLSLGLGGCVRSDLAINIAGQGNGQLVEQLQLPPQLSGREWLTKIQNQARQVGGNSRLLGPQSLEVTIPFRSGPELSQRWQRFWQPLAQTENLKKRSQGNPSPLPPLPSNLQLQEQNFLLLLRGHLRYDLDLRSLGVQTQTGETLLSPDVLLNLHTSLTAPWGARPVNSPVKGLTKPAAETAQTTVINPGVVRQGQTLTWTLQPGYLNHLEAVYLYPSPVGWAAVAAGLLVAAGWYFKYGF
jgi:hypothetical protein